MPDGKATPAAGDTRKKLCRIVKQRCEPSTLNPHPDRAETQTSGAGLPLACQLSMCQRNVLASDGEAPARKGHGERGQG